MKLDKNTKILILGLGLMGGSYAESLTSHGFEVGAVARRQETIDYALREGIIKHGRAEIDPEYIRQFDLLIFAMYPHAFVEWIEKYQQYIKPNALISDVTGVKCSIVYKIQDMLRPDLEFIGAHPMAGKEKFGYDYSEATLFDNAYMIFTPVNADENNVDMLKELSQKIGFKGVTVSTPAEHDRIIAYTSQMPHVLACAYVSDPDAMLHNGFSAGSYKDISRVADINARLWQELFIENSSQLVGHIDVLIDNLQKIKQLIENGDHKALQDALQKARDTKAKIG